MLTNIFVVLLLIATCLVVIGFIFKKQWEYLAIAGSVLLVLLGVFLINDPLEMPSGYHENKTFIYGNDFSSYHWGGENGSLEAPSYTDREAFLFHDSLTHSTIYEPISTTLNNVLWFIIMSVGLFLFMVKVTNMRSNKRNKEQEEQEDLSY